MLATLTRLPALQVLLPGAGLDELPQVAAAAANLAVSGLGGVAGASLEAGAAAAAPAPAPAA